MTYKQTLDLLYQQLPIFQRIGSAAYKADLKNTMALCKILNHPQHKFKSIHIAGTNGKGSTSHMIASVLQSAGYKTGLYTSPHLKDFRERIRINGKKIPKHEVVNFIKQYWTAVKNINPSFFEMTVALCFDYFARAKVDVAVIETGLGGRLDSTNVITPELSIITNIGYDHTNLLGDILQKIAIEKAGIIKQNIPVVVGQTQEEIKNVFIKKAKENKSEIYFADRSLSPALSKGKGVSAFHRQAIDIYLGNTLIFEKLELDLLGRYQLKNILTVLQSVEVLKSKAYKISEKAIRKGVANTVKQTGLLGRWQILSQKPLCICDTAHNVDGIKEVITQLKSYSNRQLHFVLGMVNDKNPDPLLSLLPKDAVYYFCKADIPRGLNANELKQKANQLGLKGKVFSSVKDAYTKAKNAASTKDLVFVGGSTFVVAEVL
jgi:dihydrofolate synthase/folylpolyglutamate synthase